MAHTHTHAHEDHGGDTCSHLNTHQPGADGCLHGFAQGLGLDAPIHERMCRNSFKAASAQQRIESIKGRIASLNLHNPKENATSSSDWVKRYEGWNDWEDVEELSSQMKEEEKTLQSLSENSQFVPHQHDHSIERGIFELPEIDKARLVVRSHRMGMYLYSEGQVPRADHMFQVACSYYEYCFPESDDAQDSLDELRRKCVLNRALCNIHLHNYRTAEQMCTQVISDINCKSPSEQAKAYYRRAMARRCMHDFSGALSDCRTALGFEASSQIQRELHTLQLQQQAYEVEMLSLGKRMFGNPDGNPRPQEQTLPQTKGAKHLSDGVASLMKGDVPSISDTLQPLVYEADWSEIFSFARECDSSLGLSTSNIAEVVNRPLLPITGYTHTPAPDKDAECNVNK